MISKSNLDLSIKVSFMIYQAMYVYNKCLNIKSKYQKSDAKQGS